MRKTFASMALLFIAACGSATPKAGSTEPKVGSAERVEMMKTVKIEAADATNTAVAKAPGRVVDLELRSKGGKAVWEVDILGADGKVMEVDVDADSGAVNDSESTEPKVGERVAMLKAAKIEAADATKTAIAKAQGRVVDLELRSKGGKTVWEVDILGADGKVVEVDVDADSGAVKDSE
jgi:uncharacterized membrane protein YkoI